MAEAPEAEVVVRLVLEGLGTFEKAVKLSAIKPGKAE
jgi:hypothetical protein